VILVEGSLETGTNVWRKSKLNLPKIRSLLNFVQGCVQIAYKIIFGLVLICSFIRVFHSIYI
jgi:hypothetical protein